ncbi:hypothetical protein CCH79_00018789 [Gambusia affinis]|uniref:Alkylated DNA repair protein AlkB homologue 8 N-terminal domain-containing protein n=1 Tax=Gambusia affinis TaxID=33528 RepID=A0A315W8N9_GAMAF|nr:hypothetical protein CCH79_00018789 [Gambusia affinis]
MQRVVAMPTHLTHDHLCSLPSSIHFSCRMEGASEGLGYFPSHTMCLYFKDLLNPTNMPSIEEAEPGDSGSGSPISGDEVAEVVKKLISGRAPAVDELHSGFLKALDVVGFCWLTQLCNIAWTSGAVPLDWQTGVVVPLFRRGDRGICSNYRGVTLLSLPGKVYSGVLERRVCRIVEPQIQEDHIGPWRSDPRLQKLAPGRLPGEVFRARPTGRRPQGRPRTRWMDYVSRLTWERLGIPPEELEEVAGEREKAQQRLYFLRILKKNSLPSDLLQAFYHCSIESVLTYSLCVWYGSSTSSDKKALQMVVRAAERTIGCPLPTMEQIYTSRLRKKVMDILNDSSHPGHGLFQLLPSGKRYRAIKTRTNRLKNCFYPMAIMGRNGHLVRMPPGRLPGEVLRARPTGRRPRGRPRTRGGMPCPRNNLPNLQQIQSNSPTKQQQDQTAERPERCSYKMVQSNKKLLNGGSSLNLTLTFILTLTIAYLTNLIQENAPIRSRL